jgi:hypothetical protein
MAELDDSCRGCPESHRPPRKPSAAPKAIGRPASNLAPVGRGYSGNQKITKQRTVNEFGNNRRKNKGSP